MTVHGTPPSALQDSERLKQRLAAYSRYAAIVQAQFKALEEEDVSRFSELAVSRQEIQDELGSGAQGIPGVGELDQEGRELLKDVQEELKETVALDQEFRDRLLRLRGDLGAQIQALNQREGSVKQYLSRDGQPSPERSHRLNVRL
jgi:hypothetical protein